MRGVARSVALVTACWVAACGGAGEDAPEEAAPSEATAAEVEATRGITSNDWTLVSIDMMDGGDMTPDAGALPRLVFSAEATPTGSRHLSGFGGCSQFSGAYDAGRTGRLSITGNLSMTGTGCPAAAARLEQVLGMALDGATAYEVEEDRLSISFGGGVLQLLADDRSR